LGVCHTTLLCYRSGKYTLPLNIYKVIKAKILDETNNGKLKALEREYRNFQKALRGEDAKLYSATKQQAERLLRKIKKQNGGKLKQKEYPLILRRDVYNVWITDNKLSKYWIKIPVYGVKGGIKLPIKPHCEIDMSWKFREAKVFRKKNGWFVHITVEKEVEINQEYDNVIAVDLGIRWIVTVVSTADKRPTFYGKELRRVRGHYFYLRRKLGKLKKFKAIKKVRNKEKRMVDDLLHKISRKIVNKAKEENAVIVLGDLKGIRKQDKGRKFNRKLNSFPYYRLSKFIEYKALWEGIAVIKVNEANTSKLCSRCNSQGLRRNGKFVCPNCGIELNADYNGALNILKRVLGHMSKAGAVLTQPELGGMKLLQTNPESPDFLVVGSVKNKEKLKVLPKTNKTIFPA
jgi:putative transposase